MSKFSRVDVICNEVFGRAASDQEIADLEDDYDDEYDPRAEDRLQGARELVALENERRDLDRIYGDAIQEAQRERALDGADELDEPGDKEDRHEYSKGMHSDRLKFTRKEMTAQNKETRQIYAATKASRKEKLRKLNAKWHLEELPSRITSYVTRLAYAFQDPLIWQIYGYKIFDRDNSVILDKYVYELAPSVASLMFSRRSEHKILHQADKALIIRHFEKYASAALLGDVFYARKMNTLQVQLDATAAKVHEMAMLAAQDMAERGKKSTTTSSSGADLITLYIRFPNERDQALVVSKRLRVMHLIEKITNHFKKPCKRITLIGGARLDGYSTLAKVGLKDDDVVVVQVGLLGGSQDPLKNGSKIEDGLRQMTEDPKGKNKQTKAELEANHASKKGKTGHGPRPCRNFIKGACNYTNCKFSHDPVICGLNGKATSVVNDNSDDSKQKEIDDLRERVLKLAEKLESREAKLLSKDKELRPIYFKEEMDPLLTKLCADQFSAFQDPTPLVDTMDYYLAKYSHLPTPRSMKGYTHVKEVEVYKELVARLPFCRPGNKATDDFARSILDYLLDSGYVDDTYEIEIIMNSILVDMFNREMRDTRIKACAAETRVPKQDKGWNFTWPGGLWGFMTYILQSICTFLVLSKNSSSSETTSSVTGGQSRASSKSTCPPAAQVPTTQCMARASTTLGLSTTYQTLHSRKVCEDSSGQESQRSRSSTNVSDLTSEDSVMSGYTPEGARTLMSRTNSREEEGMVDTLQDSLRKLDEPGYLGIPGMMMNMYNNLTPRERHAFRNGRTFLNEAKDSLTGDAEGVVSDLRENLLKQQNTIGTYVRSWTWVFGEAFGSQSLRNHTSALWEILWFLMKSLICLLPMLIASMGCGFFVILLMQITVLLYFLVMTLLSVSPIFGMVFVLCIILIWTLVLVIAVILALYVGSLAIYITTRLVATLWPTQSDTCGKHVGSTSTIDTRGLEERNINLNRRT